MSNDSDSKEIFRRMKDTGWIPMVLDNFANYGGAYQTAQYRKIFGMVYLRGMVMIKSNAQSLMEVAASTNTHMAHDLPLVESTTFLKGLAQNGNVAAFYLFDNNSYLFWGSGGLANNWVNLDGIVYASYT